MIFKILLFKMLLVILAILFTIKLYAQINIFNVTLCLYLRMYSETSCLFKANNGDAGKRGWTLFLCLYCLS